MVDLYESVTIMYEVVVKIDEVRESLRYLIKNVMP